jgi:hypothetical protein
MGTMLSGIKFHLVQQVITNNLWDINGETLVTVVKKDKFSLISWFEQFKKNKYGSR